jgi:hypothetical protein
MTIISDAMICGLLNKHNKWCLYDASRSVIDDSKVMVQIVAAFMIIIYDCNMFKVQDIASC